jgi:hypothetical protein
LFLKYIFLNFWWFCGWVLGNWSKSLIK